MEERSRTAHRTGWQGGGTRHFFCKFLVTTTSRGAVAAVLPIFLLLVATPAHAGRYELVKGKGVEVCEVYGRNLNSFGHYWPMNCEREVDPDFAKEGLTKPEWQKLDVVKHFDLVVAVDKLLNPTTYSKYYNEKQIQQNIADIKVRAEKSLDINLANLDIDNDGKAEPVIEFSYGCAPPGSGGWWAIPLLVADPSLSAVDLPKSRPLFQNESTDREKYPAGGWRYTMYDVFLFKGKSYFDRWSDSREDIGMLRVFSTQQNRTTEICTYEYKYDEKQ